MGFTERKENNNIKDSTESRKTKKDSDVSESFNYYIIVLVRSTELGFISGMLRLEINYYYY